MVGGEVGRDVPPHQMGLGESVQQHDRTARAADGGIERDAVGDGDALVVESVDPRFHGDSFRCSVGYEPAGRG
ncbi:hypothetical protein GCM10022205_29080 [Spinactinospora alkalitolerans]